MNGNQAEISPQETDVVFGAGGGRELKCDIYQPTAGSDKRTAVIHLHGGGFRGGNKEMIGRKAGAFVARGYVSIATQYRLGAEAKWPAQLEDVKACIRWTRANADRLGIDPARIALAGYSAGGHLALMAAGTQNRPELEGTGGNHNVGSEIAACFSYFSAEVRRPEDGSDHILLPAGAADADYRAASHGPLASADFPPTIFFHGTSDVTVLPAVSTGFYQQLLELGVPVEMHTFHGVPHEFDMHPEFGDACAAICDFFLERLVINPRTYPPFGMGRRPAVTA